MPTIASGAISLGYLQSYFGGSTASMSNYYRGGGAIPDITQNAAIATSGSTSLGNYYSKWGFKSFTTVLGVQEYTSGKYADYGYSKIGTWFGYIGTQYFITPNGTMDIRQLVWNGFNPGTLYLSIYGTTINDDSTFRFFTVNGSTYYRSNPYSGPYIDTQLNSITYHFSIGNTLPPGEYSLSFYYIG